MEQMEFIRKKERLANLLKEAQMLASEMLEAEKERYAISDKAVLDCIMERNHEGCKSAEFNRHESMINKGNLDCTFNALRFEIERMALITMGGNGDGNE